MSSGERGPAAGSAARWVSLLLPGLRHYQAGRRGLGAALAASWLFFVATAAYAWPRIVAVPRTGSLDDWIALATLIAGLAAVGWAGASGHPAAVRLQ